MFSPIALLMANSLSQGNVPTRQGAPDPFQAALDFATRRSPTPTPRTIAASANRGTDVGFGRSLPREDGQSGLTMRLQGRGERPGNPFQEMWGGAPRVMPDTLGQTIQEPDLDVFRARQRIAQGRNIDPATGRRRKPNPPQQSNARFMRDYDDDDNMPAGLARLFSMFGQEWDD